MQKAQTRHPEGLALRTMIEPRTRPVDIARQAGVSRQFVHAVLIGKEKASPRIIEACLSLGLPVDLIWPEASKNLRTPRR